MLTNPTYSHSGSLGDLIYSLVIPKHFGAGDYYIKLRAMEHTCTKYGYRPEHFNSFHKGKMTEVEFNMLKPLLEVQPYIKNVITTDDKEIEVNYDLDKFRGVLFRSFYGNYLEAYYKTFRIPYTHDNIIAPWLHADPNKVAQIVVSRTFRMRTARSMPTWQRFVTTPGFEEAAIFVGMPDEHADFEKTFGIKIPYYKSKDFLDMAQVIAGCDLFIGNSTFAYSLAQGLGKTTMLESRDDMPLLQDEAYFPRKDCTYF